MKKLEERLAALIKSRLCTRCKRVLDREVRLGISLRERMKSLQPLLQEQRRRAKKDVDWLLEARPGKQLERVQRSRRLRSRPAVEELFRRSHEIASRDAGTAARLAWLAFEVANNLVAEPDLAGGPTAIADLQAHACALLGNAARVACDFDRADGHFRAGRFHLGQGSGDGLVRAEVFWLEASFRKDARQPAAALRLLAEAEMLCKETGEDHLRGKILMKRAAVLGDEGDLEGALRANRQSVHFLDADQEPHLLLIEYQNLAVTYGKLGRWADAEKVLDATEEDFLACRRVAETSVRHFRLWTRARIAHGLGEMAKAEATYLETSRLFAATANPYDEALVGLDLARLYAEAARLDDVARQAEEVLRALETQPLEPEAFAAVALFVETARRREAIEAVLRAAIEALERLPRSHRRPN